jgi:SAM-dependent methyltransferase
LSERFRYRGVAASPALSAAQRAAFDELLQRLEGGVYRQERSPCPCGLAAAEALVAEIDRFGLPLNSVLCLGCGSVRLDPHLDHDSLDDFYRTLYQDLYGRFVEPDTYFDRQRGYGRRISATCFPQSPPSQSRVLEIGCGAAGGLSVFQEQGCSVAGCELSPQLIDYGSRRGVRNLHVGTLAETAGKMSCDGFDLIYLHHVFEHVDQPLDLLQEISRRLAPAGRAIVIVPDLGRIDRFRVPAGDALVFFHVAHKYNYTPLGLRRLAAQAGLAARQIQPVRRPKTVWSSMPELWIELRLAAESQQGSTRGDRHEGPSMLNYLQRTERRFRWGLCRAQVLDRLRGVRRWVKSLAGKRDPR